MSLAFAEILGWDPLELWLLGGLAVVMFAALARSAWAKRSMRSRENEIDPFLVFPESIVRRPMTPSPFQGLAWAPPRSSDDDEESYQASPPAAFRPTPAPSVVPVPIQGGARAVPVPTPNQGGGRDVPVPGPVPAPQQQFAAPAPVLAPYRQQPATGLAPAAQRMPPAPAAMRSAWSTTPAPRSDEVDEASETIRLPTAADGTVQLLPGMLVMTQGPEVGREYRFLRIGSQPIPEVTMGRANGAPYRHIHLPAVTVSRMHARIRYQDRSWRIANLSMTNPLCLNGHELRPMEESILSDGDRIQLGEVELSYRDQRL